MAFIREHLPVIVFFLLLTFLFTFPVTAHMADTVVEPSIDTPLNIWIMSWNGHALGTDPTALFQANMNYPSADSLAFSEHLMTFSVIAIPLGWITGNPVLTYNLLLFISFALCGYAMYLLAKYLTSNRLAALAAGVFFALVPYHFSTIIHVHVCLYGLQPLLLLFLFKYFDRGRTGDLVGLGLTFLAQALLSWYQLAFSLIPLALFFIWRLFSRRGRERWRRLLAVFAVLALCGVLILPFALPYFRLHRDMSDRETHPALEVINEASMDDYWRVLSENWAYKRFGSLFYDKLGLDPTATAGAGNALFPGFTFFPLVLLAIGFSLLAWRKNRGRAAAGTPSCGEAPGGTWPEETQLAGEGEELPPEGRSPPGESLGEDTAPAGKYFLFFLVLALIAMILSLGSNAQGPENYLYELISGLPFFEFVRFPIRYHILVNMSMAVVVAYACAYIYRWVTRRGGKAWSTAVVGMIILLMVLEFMTVGIPDEKMAVGDTVPAVYRDLALVEGAVVVEAPMPVVYNSIVFEDPITLNWGSPVNYINSVISEQDVVYFSIYHWKPVVNGLSGYYPVFYRRALVVMQTFPEPQALEFLAAAGVNHIVMRWEQVPEENREIMREDLAAAPGLELVRDYPDGYSLYRLAGVETIAASDLELRTMLPQAVPPGEEFRGSLAFFNRSQVLFSNLDETRQNLRLRWVDGEGEVVKSGGDYFFAPFFLREGEGSVSNFFVEAPVEAGVYRLEITAEGGILDGSTWEADITVAEVPSTLSDQTSAGDLEWDRPQGPPTDPYGEEAELSLPRAAVFSLEMTAANSGQTFWRKGGPLADSGVDTGAVAVSAEWSKVDSAEYPFIQMGMIPCDMSPGQEMSFPIALQSPYEEGEYTLTLRLKVLGVRYIGEPVVIRVHIGTP